MVFVQSAFGIASQHQVVALGEALVGECGGGGALGAVAGSREGHQQGRQVLGEVFVRVGDDVRSSDGVEAALEALAEPAAVAQRA